MKDTPTRVFGLMCVLVGVWTTVYWLYEPGDPPVTFDQSSPAPAGDDSADALTRGPMAELSPPISPSPDRRPQLPPPQPMPQPPAARTPAAPPAAPLGDHPKTRVIPPEFFDYTVQRGDTLETIAKKFLGDGRLWTKIAESNGLRDPNKLIPGRTTLRIPKDPTNIQGKEVPIPDATPAQPAPRTEPATPAAPPAPAAQQYVVKSGDTLSGIAKQFYGKSALWRLIYDANKDVIDDPDAVKPGITLRIPPAE